ncbi:class I SAM-dependent DNA methyltransferase [Helicobacter sp. MIT 14-3879]|uniref:HsdM family class I SAM-dependent methyltransferase n=1 Tax=Helicobacter sp. MIT 14-3879 TaxID=2040649 RepID=UPI000E1F05D9|nr:N-6 DNA methylase [Helicobacter sp. MIT 14-3879]RDU61311.1 SAM-dependent methyltransferase [Helicobacter sp. MIT 14-3879]
MSFVESKDKFDRENINKDSFSAFLPEHLTINKQVRWLKSDGSKNEQYYKWQFLFSIIDSKMFAKDYIGTEIYLPKGNKNSAPLKIDAVIFDDKTWFSKYQDYHTNNNLESLQWLKEHILAVIEFKKEDSKSIAEVYDKQLKAYMKESEKSFCLGILYDTERLYLFKKQSKGDKTIFLRYSQEFNQKGEDSKTSDLSLHLPDPYSNIPDFEHLKNFQNPKPILRDKRKLNELDTISGLHSTTLNQSMRNILYTLDKVGLANQKGYLILIQILSLKIYDEKHNSPLQFYILEEEANYQKISDEGVQNFIKRIETLIENASGNYRKILKSKELDFKNENHLKVLICIVKEFQDYSFVNSHKSDLYQLIFHHFAQPFAKDSNAQFLTPLPLIDFLVSIVNPRNGESVIDPTVGIADFLSVSYVNSHSKLNDNNIFGVDIDEQMISLATLNMLLNGDGNATLEQKSDLGSIAYKFDKDNKLLELDSNFNAKGDWDNRADDRELKKFDVVLTNPPFGEKRSFNPITTKEKDIIQCYETWEFYDSKIDLGVVFLENAYRILKDYGRFGIVLSNSIASIDTHKLTRQWLMDKCRIVAIFDLPANTFAETGVNVSMIVAYKPPKAELENLKKQGYSIFIKNIENIGYEIKTIDRVKTFCNVYKINPENFEVEFDSLGRAKLDEDFSQTIRDFKSWCAMQEESLQKIFIQPK